MKKIQYCLCFPQSFAQSQTGVCMCYLNIHYFPMLVAIGSFSPERGLPVNFCVDFNHFQSIVMSAFVHSKTFEMLISEQL